MFRWSSLTGGARQVSNRFHLNLERLDGRDLPSITIGDPPVMPPQSSPPTPTSPAYATYLVHAQQAYVNYETTENSARAIYDGTVNAANSQLESSVLHSYQAAEAAAEPIVQVLKTTTDQAWDAFVDQYDSALVDFNAAMAIAGSNTIAQQTAIAAFNSRVETHYIVMVAAVTTAFNVADQALLPILAQLDHAIAGAATTWNAAMIQAEATYTSVAQVAYTAYTAAEQLAWDTYEAAEPAAQPEQRVPLQAPKEKPKKPGVTFFDGKFGIEQDKLDPNKTKITAPPIMTWRPGAIFPPLRRLPTVEFGGFDMTYTNAPKKGDGPVSGGISIIKIK